MSKKKEELKEEVKEEVENIDEAKLEVADEKSQLEVEIKELKEQVKELENKYFMAYADAQNISKRAQIDADNLVINKVTSMVENILPALDNFERALSIKTEDENVKNFLKGFEMVYNQLYQSLEAEGITRIESVNTDFDPDLHQAIEMVKDENFESGKVVEELLKGYKFRGRTIRVAMVKVSE